MELVGIPDLVRIRSGISGLDDLIEGGLPFPSVVLVAGPAGIGKTTFGLQFLFEGAKDKQTGLYFSALSDSPQYALRSAFRYNFIDKNLYGKQIRVVPLEDTLENPKSMLQLIEDAITEYVPQRVVIDPITNIPNNGYRSFTYKLANKLRNWGTATILTGELFPEEPYPTQLSHVIDGIILLNYNKLDEDRRKKYLEILKMRGTQHSTGKHLANISKDGLAVNPGLR